MSGSVPADYQPILRRVGNVLIIVGVLDIGVLIYCILADIGYASSINILALIAGWLLRRSRLGAARLVTQAAAFILTAGGGAVLVLVVVGFPPEFWLIYPRLHPIQFLSLVAVIGALLALLVWILRELRSPPVLQARAAAERSTSPPRVSFGLGIALAVLLGVGVFGMQHSAPAIKAMSIAGKTFANGYHYVPLGVQRAAGRTVVRLAAFNKDEIRTMSVDSPTDPAQPGTAGQP